MNDLIKIPEDILYLIHITQNENTEIETYPKK